MESTVAGIAFERMGDGEPLLLLHGTGGSRMHWRPVLGMLAAERDLIVVDLPGHGASPAPPAGVPHSPIGYAGLLAGLLDELGLDSAHVAGNSVGGWTSLEIAKNGRARSVVAIAPAGLWAKRDPWRCVLALWSQHKMGRAFAPLVPPLLRSPTGRALLMGGSVAKPRQISAEDAVELAEVYAATPGFDRHLADTRRARFADGAEIDVPVTVAWGEKDRLLPARARLAEELPAQARQVTLGGCGHMAMWDDPELVTDVVLAAGLGRCAGAAGA
jgi:pimeloyl-ACP methyl ester carboxylesterase